MRKHNVKGKSMDIAAREMPVRASRHGRPLMEVFFKTHREVTTNPTTGQIEVVHTRVPMTLEEIQRERAKVKRAVDSTLDRGARNRS